MRLSILALLASCSTTPGLDCGYVWYGGGQLTVSVTDVDPSAERAWTIPGAEDPELTAWGTSHTELVPGPTDAAVWGAARGEERPSVLTATLAVDAPPTTCALDAVTWMSVFAEIDAAGEVWPWELVFLGDTQALLYAGNLEGTPAPDGTATFASSAAESGEIVIADVGFYHWYSGDIGGCPREIEPKGATIRLAWAMEPSPTVEEPLDCYPGW